MPNFKCKSVKEISLPFEAKGVCFEWSAQNERTRLIYTAVEQGAFFVQVGQNAKNEFIIKGEKHSKPEQIGLLQKALLVFKENFCDEILNEAFALKHTRLLAQSAYIQNDISALSAKFKDFDKVFLEIGFGSGRHLLWQARTNPDTLIIGVEIYAPAIEQVAKLAQKERLNNVFLVKSDARLLLNILPTSVLTKIFLHFPVPWDKQAGRKVLSKNFAVQCLRVLKAKGCFELRTDSAEYFELGKSIFSSFENVKIQLAKNENLDISSKYETRWKKQNKDIYDLRAVCEKSSNLNPAKLPLNDENLGFEKAHLQDENLNLKATNLNTQKTNSKDKNSPFIVKNSSLYPKNLNFSPKKLAQIYEKFSQNAFHFKGDDFFLRLESVYFISKENLLVKLAFGAFDKPQHSFLFLGDETKFLFQAPFATKENHKALEKLSEFLR